MSYINEINEKINNTVSKFIHLISEKYSLDYDELYTEWNSTGNLRVNASIKAMISKEDEKSSPKQATKPSPKPSPKQATKPNTSSKLNISNAELSLQTVDVLKGMCKDRGLKCSGKKSELIERLKGTDSVNNTESHEKAKEETKVKVQTNKSKSVPDIFKNIEKTQIAIRRNNFGNYEHDETGFLFNDIKKVYGVQQEDGSIRCINKEDIDLCNKYKFSYIIPENLNTNDQEDEELEIEEDGEEYIEEYVEEDVNEVVEIEEEVEEEINEEDILQSDEEYEEVEEEEEV